MAQAAFMVAPGWSLSAVMQYPASTNASYIFGRWTCSTTSRASTNLTTPN